MLTPDSSAPAGSSSLRPAHVVPVPLAELVGSATAELIQPDASLGAGVVVTGVTADSSDVRPGDLFAALSGRTTHGASFVATALAAGAVAVLTDPAGRAELIAAGQQDVPTLVTADPRAVLGAVSAHVYGHPADRLAVLGVTGTSGKTTTTFLIRAGLQAAGRRAGLIGTVGVFIDDTTVKTPFTTPEAPQLHALLAVMAERGLDCVAMEVSSHALRMGRVNGVRFAVGAFTNLSQDHLDFHTDMADYFAAKSLLFDGRAATEIVVVDDEWGPKLVTPATITVSGVDSPTTWGTRDVEVAADGRTSFTVVGPGGAFDAGCRIPGRYNVVNTVLALAVLQAVGIEAATAAPAVGAAQVPGRMERVEAGQEFLAVVDYSHKPAGVAGALAALRPLTPGRLIIVLGCGGDRDRGKRPVMGAVAARDADLFVVTDDNPRSEDPAEIRAAMLAGVDSVPRAERGEVVERGDRAAAIAYAVSRAGAGDTVLIAGKGHETGQEVAGTMLAFDDVTELGRAIERRAGSDVKPS